VRRNGFVRDPGGRGQSPVVSHAPSSVCIQRRRFIRVWMWLMAAWSVVSVARTFLVASHWPLVVLACECVALMLSAAIALLVIAERRDRDVFSSPKIAVACAVALLCLIPVRFLAVVLVTGFVPVPDVVSRAAALVTLVGVFPALMSSHVRLTVSARWWCAAAAVFAVGWLVTSSAVVTAAVWAMATANAVVWSRRRVLCSMEDQESVAIQAEYVGRPNASVSGADTDTTVVPDSGWSPAATGAGNDMVTHDAVSDG